MILLNSASSNRHRNLASFSIDSDASAYFSAVEAAGSSIGATARKAVNNFIIGLKADGLWSLIHQLYLYAGPDTLNGALVKAKGTGTRVNNGFVSGDFSPTLGLQGNGAKYIANGFLASQLNGISHSLFFYGSNYPISGSSSNIAGVWTGSASSLMAFDTFTTEPTTPGRAYRCGTFSFPVSPILTTGLTASGSIMASKTASNSTKIYQNGISAAVSTSSNSAIPPSLDFWSFAFNYSNAIPTGASSDRRQVEIFAQGLNDNQASILHKRTATYIENLSEFSPLSLNPALWLDASDASTLYNATSGGGLVDPDGTVARWEDKSGGGRHAIQNTSTKRPLRKSGIKAGKDVMRFDGADDGMQISSITLPTYITAYVVQISAFSSTQLKFWFEHGADINTVDGIFLNGMNSAAWAIRRSSNLHSGPSTDNADWIGATWALASFTYNGVGSLYKNKILVSNLSNVGSALTNTNVTANLNIACRNQTNLFLNGDIAEILIYPSAHSDADRALVENYLATKWAI